MKFALKLLPSLLFPVFALSMYAQQQPTGSYNSHAAAT